MAKKILPIVIALLSIIGIILFLLVVSIEDGDNAGISGAVSNMITYSVVLFGATVLAAVGASVFGLFKSPGALKKTLLGLAGLVVVLLVSYLIADSNEVLNAKNEVIAAADSSVSKMTSAGIWASLVLLVLGGLFFVFDLFKGILK